mmetsp:Transcript_58896/g.156810  ORF Transcript_58896/g.156810 Transcript_58896/m.156810 type:complete len:203 (-) Transcript_58896:8-616(-)
MMNLLDSTVLRAFFASGVKYPCFSHQALHADSTAFGSYFSCIGPDTSFLSPSGVSGTTIAVISFTTAGLASFFLLDPGSPHFGFSFTTFASLAPFLSFFVSVAGTASVVETADGALGAGTAAGATDFDEAGTTCDVTIPSASPPVRRMMGVSNSSARSAMETLARNKLGFFQHKSRECLAKTKRPAVSKKRDLPVQGWPTEL